MTHDSLDAALASPVAGALGHRPHRLCKFATVLSQVRDDQAAALLKRLNQPGGDFDVSRVLRAAGRYIHASTVYRHRNGTCICTPTSTEGTTR